jgi:hypothetical protein
MYYLAFPSYYLANPSPTPATGATYLQDKFINLNPYIGYRLNLKKIKLDILPGIDIGFNISSYDKGKAVITNYGTTYYTDFKRVNATNDVRVKLGVVSSYKKFGLNVSYAYGLTNYEKGVIGDGPNNVQSRLIRFGISYRLL